MRILSWNLTGGGLSRYNRCMQVKKMRGFTSLNIGLIAAMAILAVGCGDGAKTETTTTTGTTTTGTTAANPPGDTTAARQMPTAAGNAAKDGKVVIGMVASLNGELKPWGDDSKKGGDLAIEEF